MIKEKNIKSNEIVLVCVPYYELLSDTEKKNLDIVKKCFSKFNLEFTSDFKDADYVLSKRNKNNESIKCRIYDQIDQKPGLICDLNTNNIVNICIIAHNVYLYDENNKEFVICNYSLKKILEDSRFRGLFLRVSKENIININKIKDIFLRDNNRKIKIRLTNENIVFVNKTYKKDFLSAYCEKTGYVIK